MKVRPRVLLADDHPGVLKAFRRLLAPDCDVVASVSDCATALEATLQFRPDVVVMDVNMPGIGALETCRGIRESFPGMRIILVSAMDPDTIRGFGVAAGASTVITKDEVPDLLFPAIMNSFPS